MNEQKIISLVKKNKKYLSIADEIVKNVIEEYKRKNQNYLDYDEEFIVKEIRALLHKTHGSFQVKNNKREKLFEKLKENPSEKMIIKDILKTNTSTRERLEIYPELYSSIFRITGKPNSIADLGCGLNPISFFYMNLDKKTKYLAYDINENDNKLLNEFFKLENINGKSEIIDLTRIENIKSLPKSDICFMLKLIDVLELNKKGHSYAEDIIKILSEKCKFVVVSFSKLTVSGNKMNFPYRGWIEKMLERINLGFEMLEFENEFFYIISK